MNNDKQTPQHPFDKDDQILEATDIVINKKTELSLIWLLPVVALLVSTWLIVKSINERGPVIRISFPTAEGLEVDKTKIKYLDVEVGKVTEISINEDLKTIWVTAQMNSSAANYLHKNTSFWVVRPQVGLGGVSGLGTLLSGSYIEIKPGDGPKEHYFTGLSAAPLLKNNIEGTHYILETNNLGSMKPGTPINFHGITVGEVLSHRLSEEGNAIRLTVFVNKPYDQFVRKNSRFWIDSGIDLSAGADGFKVRTGPLISLLSGGIAFRASAEDTVKDIQSENSIFPLYDTYDLSTQVVYQNILKYVMYFNGSVRGLTIGAPVQFRGIPIGKVTDINLELDKKTAEIHIPVTVELETDRIKAIDQKNRPIDKNVMSQLINKGLRAQLQTGSLLTGQLLIDLDFHPKSKIVLSDNKTSLPEFPTTASSLDQFTHSANIIMDKVAKLPLEELTDNASHTLVALKQASDAAGSTLIAAQATLKSTEETMQSAHRTLAGLEPGSTMHYELEQLLRQLNQTTISIKQLTDYLQQNPESLVRGKKDE